MSEHHLNNKKIVWQFFHDLDAAEPRDIKQVLAKYCHEDVVWEIFYPFNTLQGIDQAADQFWGPLKESMPDLERRPDIHIAGSYKDTDWVSAMGYFVGTLFNPWLKIPATANIIYLRIGENYALKDGKIARAYVLLDIIDVMRQVGVNPLRRSPGSPELVPGPATHDGNCLTLHDDELGAKTMATVLEMQAGLPKFNGVRIVTGKHSPHWHPNMMWYGPAGIGSCRGRKGFRDFHGVPFLTAFPDRGSEGTPGHYIRIGDGRFAVTSGWPSLKATHLGGGWLGLPPSGRPVEMRVADWYRADHDGLLIENWVMIDILHMLSQFGLDVLEEMDISLHPDRPRSR